MFILATAVLYIMNANGILVPHWLLIVLSIIACIEAVFWVIAILLQRGILKQTNKDDWNK